MEGGEEEQRERERERGLRNQGVVVEMGKN